MPQRPVTHYGEPAPKPVGIPLSARDRQRLIVELGGLPEAVRGNDVAVLVDYIAFALNPAPTEYRLLGFDGASFAAFRRERDEVRKRFAKMVAAARHLSVMMPHDRKSQQPTEAAANQWPSHLDPFAAAVGPFLHSAGRDVPVARIGRLRTAVRLIAAVPDERSGSPGRPYETGPGSGLVRAVCYYRHRQKLSVSFEWPNIFPRAKLTDEASDRQDKHRRGGRTERLGDNLEHSDDTTKLIVAAAAAFRLDTDRSKLRTHLLNYSDELTAMGREQPDAIDLYGPMFDTNPVKTRRKSNS